MTKNLLQLTITKVDGPIFEGEVTSVTVPGADGEMTILANHEALISLLTSGEILVRTEAKNQKFEVVTGTIEISDNHAIVLL